MKKLRFLYRLIAVMFMAVALTACSSSSKDDDDDDDEKSEKIDSNKSNKREAQQDIPAQDKNSSSNSVDDLCATMSDLTYSVSQLTNLDDLSSIQSRFKPLLENYKYNNTTLDDNDREKLYNSFMTLFTTLFDKSVSLELANSNENVSTSEIASVRSSVINNFDNQIKTALERSETVGDFCKNINQVNI